MRGITKKILITLSLRDSAGASYNFDNSRARAYALIVGAGGGGLDIFTLIYPFSSFSLSWETARYRLKYCLKGPLDQKQPTNQILETVLSSNIQHFTLNILLSIRSCPRVNCFLGQPQGY